jgi:hypothetical protein
MMIFWTIVGALMVVGSWAFILWLAARSDRKFLEQERLNRVFGGDVHG